MFPSRKAVPDDVHELARFVNAVFRTAEEISDYMEGSRTNSSEILKALNKGTTILVIENNTIDSEFKFLGCVAIKSFPSSTNKKISEIGMLSVLPTKQSMGIGTYLMDKAMEYSRKEMEAEEIVVGILSVRKRMMRWYEKIGFKDTGETQEFQSDTEKATVPMHMCIFKRPA